MLKYLLFKVSPSSVITGLGLLTSFGSSGVGSTEGSGVTTGVSTGCSDTTRFF